MPPDGASLSLSWNPNVLRYIDATVANPPWDTSFISDTEALTGSLDYVFLSDTDGEVGAVFDLASFTFESLTEASSSLLEISDDSYGVGFVSPGANPIHVAYQGLSIDVFAPVPVPAAIWLFASGLFVLHFKGLIRLPRSGFH